MSPCLRHRFVFSARQGGLLVLGLTLAAVALLASPAVQANQNASGTITGYDPKHGTVTVDWDGNTSTFDIGSQNAIIEFQKFGIAPNEIVNFTGGDFRVLNRVVGGDISEIAGQLSATGILYLVNEAGVHFADGAMVDVAGLFAAGGNISNQDFLDGVDRFTGLEGNVINEGVLQIQSGGPLHLLGKQVANVGIIQAPASTVTMIAANDVWLSESANGRVLVRVRGEGFDADDDAGYTELDGEGFTAGDTPANLDAETAGVEQAGAIDADGGHVVLGAGDLYSLAVRHSGSTRAGGGDVEVLATDGGIDVSGNVDVSGGNPAGRIHIHGPTVALRGGTLLGAMQPVLVEAQHDLSVEDAVSVNDVIVRLRAGRDLSMLAPVVGARMLLATAHHEHYRELTEEDGQMFFDLGESMLVTGQAMRLTAPQLVLMSDLLLDGGQFGAELDGDVVSGVDGEGMAPALMILSPAEITGVVGTSDAPLSWVQMGAEDRTSGEVVLGGGQVHTELHQHYHRRVVFDRTTTLDAGTEVQMLAGGEAGVSDPRPGLTVDAPLFVIDGGLGGSARLHFLAAMGQTVARGDGTALIKTDGLQLYLLGLEVEEGAALSLVAELVEGDTPHQQGASVAVLGPTGGAGSLSVDAGDRVEFWGAVSDLASLNVTSGDRVHFAVANEESIPESAIAGPLTINAANEMVVEHHLRGFSELNVQAGVASFQGDIDSDAAMTVNADNLIEVLGDVTGLSQAVLNSGGGVQLLGVVDGVAVFSVDAEAAQFMGTIDGVDDFQVDADNFVVFGEDIGAGTALGSFTVNAGQMIGLGRFDEGATMLVRVDGDIALNAEGRADIPDTATIAGPDLHLHSLNGSVIMGQHEKLTALDGLRIDAADVVELGDVSTLGDMVVNAGSAIVLLTREAGPVLVNEGGELVSVMDEGVDYVAGGQILFNMQPTLSGEGAAPAFASLLPDAAAEGSDVGAVARIASLSREDLLTEQFVLDAHAQRPLWVAPIEPTEPAGAPGSLAVALASDGPDVSQHRAAAQAEAWLPGDVLEALADLGVDVRSASPDQAVIEDFDTGVDQRIVVTSARLRSSAVRSMLDAYGAVMTRRVGDEAVSRADAVQQRLTAAWNDYVDARGEDAPAEEFRGYLATRSEHRLAQAYLDGLAEALRRAGRLGLNERETAQLRVALLAPVTPEGLAAQTFEHAVTGQSPLRREVGTPAPAESLGAAVH